MAALLERAEQAVSITEVARSTKDIFDRLVRGEQDRYVVMRNNEPAAVILAVWDFEAIMDELENLRLEAVARDRLTGYDPRTAISHDELWRSFDGEVEGAVPQGGKK